MVSALQAACQAARCLGRALVVCQTARPKRLRQTLTLQCSATPPEQQVKQLLSLWPASRLARLRPSAARLCPCLCPLESHLCLCLCRPGEARRSCLFGRPFHLGLDLCHPSRHLCRSPFGAGVANLTGRCGTTCLPSLLADLFAASWPLARPFRSTSCCYCSTGGLFHLASPYRRLYRNLLCLLLVALASRPRWAMTALKPSG